jgi:hypothetical protein
MSRGRAAVPAPRLRPATVPATPVRRTATDPAEEEATLALGIASPKQATTPTSAAPSGSSPTAPAVDQQPVSPAEASGSVVISEVIGNGTANNVTYFKEGFSQEQVTSAKLPFKKEIQFKEQVGSFSPLSLVAQNGGKGGNITCRISVDGKVVGESTSSGQYAVVTCNSNG